MDTMTAETTTETAHRDVVTGREAHEGPVLRCRELRKSFGAQEAVRGLSFEVHPGEAYGLLGPNG